MYIIINSYYTLCGTKIRNVLNCENYWGHYAGHFPQSRSTMHVYNPQYYSVCIDTNIHRQSNTSVTDVLTTPDMGNIVFTACKCQLSFKDCDVDNSLNDSLPVLCTLDFIKSLDTGHTHQVVFLHDSRGLSSGFYYMYQESVDSICLYVCHDEELGPFQVIDSKLARVVFCNQGLAIDWNANLTPNQVFDDYKKDLWAHVNHDMDYTQYIESIIDELCRFMDLLTHKAETQAHDAPNDATDILLVPYSITALLGDDIAKPSQVDHDAYIPSKTAGFVSHEHKSFEFIGPD